MNRAQIAFRWWAHRPFVTAAAFFALAALVAADLNGLEIAAALFAFGLPFAFASFVGWADRRLPEEGRARLFSRSFVRKAAIASLVLASALTNAY